MEPVLHRFPELFERNTGADFHRAVADGYGVVESTEVGKAAHGEGIEPLQRAGKLLSAVVIRHADFAREHPLIKAQQSGMAERDAVRS